VPRVANCDAGVVGSTAAVAGSASAAASAFCPGATNPEKTPGATGGGGAAAAPKLNTPEGGAGVGATGVADLGEAAEKKEPPPPMPGTKLEGRPVAPLVKPLLPAAAIAAAVDPPLGFPN
jgi:hypothetical protein